MLFEDAYSKYKKYACKMHKKQSYDNLMYDFKHRVLPYFNGYNIYDITKQDIVNWKDYVLDFNYCNKYNGKIYYVFNDFLDYCCVYHNLNCNYLKELGGFKCKDEFNKTDYYTLKEFKKFIKQFDNIIYKSYFIIMFYTGLRPGECMALKFNDFDGKYLHITKSIERRGNRNLCTTKNKYSIRDIVVNNIIKKYIKKLSRYYLKFYGTFDYDYFILGGKKPLAPTTIDRYKKSACIKANIRTITQHQFRHSYATYLISNNIPLNVVSRLLGHSNVSITSKVYVHHDLTQEKRVLKTLNSKHILFFK